MATGPLTLQEINAFDQDMFVERLGELFEGSPWIVVETWHNHPFISIDHLYTTLCTVMYNAPVERQIVLLKSHPDLVGRAALAGTLSLASTHEQASAGLDDLSPEEIATFTRYNQTYRDRYGFPFVICARENKKEAILAGLESRMRHSREQEIAIALGEVAKICKLRLDDLLRAPEPTDLPANELTTLAVSSFQYLSSGSTCVSVRPLTP